MKKYRIKSLVEKENGRYLYWTNAEGWTFKKYTDQFTYKEKTELRLPVWSIWEEVK